MVHDTGTFERLEKKYLLTGAQLDGLRERLHPFLRPDRYGLQTVASLYYDTPDFALIRRSLDGPVYKEKLRLRCYGRAGRHSDVFVEIKKKFRGVVYKRRAVMPLDEAERLIQTGVAALPLNQVQREIRFMASYWHLSPSAYIACDRMAYADPEGSPLRVTLDTNIRFRFDRLALWEDTAGETLLPAGQTLMEIKIPGAFPLWLSGALGELGIYPVSYSKYGQSYQRTLLGTAGQKEGKNHVA